LPNYQEVIRIFQRGLKFLPNGNKENPSFLKLILINWEFLKKKEGPFKRVSSGITLILGNLMENIMENS